MRDIDQVAKDLGEGLSLIQQACRRAMRAEPAMVQIGVRVIPIETNPDAAVADAAQEAIEESVHGQESWQEPFPGETLLRQLKATMVSRDHYKLCHDVACRHLEVMEIKFNKMEIERDAAKGKLHQSATRLGLARKACKGMREALAEMNVSYGRLHKLFLAEIDEGCRLKKQLDKLS